MSRAWFICLGAATLASCSTGSPLSEPQAVAVGARVEADVHEGKNVVVAHDHRVTVDEFEAAIAGGVSALGVDLIVDGQEWFSGAACPPEDAEGCRLEVPIFASVDASGAYVPGARDRFDAKLAEL